MRSPTVPLTVLVLLAALVNAGCQQQTLRQSDQTRKDLQKLRDENRALQQTLTDQQQQIRLLQALGEKRLETLFTVQRIELGRYTGGANFDDIAGDDGIKVFLKPIDQHGSVIKAPGSVQIQLFDLAKPDNLIGLYEWSAETIAEHWSSGFMAYHYSFECPWKADPPSHNEITVRVQFTDYLTGKTFTAQKLCRIKQVTAGNSESD